MRRNPWPTASVPIAGLLLLLTFSASGAAYDADSWKDLIPADCKAYFDGCNNCRKGADGQAGACTRKACQSYQKPVCLDAGGDAAAAADAIRVVRYLCDGGARFAVHYGEYRADDQRTKLGEDEIMLSDRQTHTAYLLRRDRAASGGKYSDGKIEFWGRGNESMLRQNGDKLYQNCRSEG